METIATRSSLSIPFREVIYGAFLFFIPFSQALSINVGFPLKLSELFLFAIIAFEITTNNISNWKLKKPVAITALLFIGCTLLSVIVNAFYKYPYDLMLNVVRISPLFDSVLKFFYIIISFLALFATRYALKTDKKYIEYFFWGGIAAASYGWYLFLSGMLKIPVLLLPGMDANPQTYNVGLGDVIRCATFKEGNYMGFFLLISGITAMLFDRKKLSLFFFISIITTFSTTSTSCLIIYLIIYSAIKYKRHKLKFISIVVAIAVVVGLLVQFSDDFRTIIYNKLFASEDEVENVNDIYSKADRLNTTLIAWEIGKDNPFFGVGPSNFGLHYNHYNQLPDFQDFELKRIPNNIYAEIFSEYGGIAFCIFMIFMWFVLKNSARKSPPIIIGGLIAACIYFFAFPTFTMLFIWVFLGIILS